MSENKNIRAFLAIDPPGVVLENIQAMQNRLKKNIQGVIRWVRPEGIHLTLKFFGDISAQDVANISGVIARRTNATQPFALEISSLGAFPDAIRPRIIWLGITGQLGQLLSLQKELEEEFFTLGFPKEDRPFRAHLTMGRVKVPKGIIGLDAAVDAGGKLTAGSFTVGEVALFQSSLSPQGAIYTRLAVFPLQGDKL